MSVGSKKENQKLVSVFIDLGEKTSGEGEKV